MPYADPHKQRQAQRESARRRRALAAVASPDLSPVTIQDIYRAGQILGRAKGRDEPNEAYHEELRRLWRQFLRVVE